ncbi:MAG TPA: hypothetical protein VNS81_08240 [Nocardioides sp.]|nr:hypothetical protein [Nocardioides sp.]
MDQGAFDDARAELLALAADAAPHPVPAEQVVALLKETGSADPEALGRLAYHALTGVDPGPAGQAAERPSDVLPGFPTFASEVLARAVNGPEDRRPTAAALLMVLQTTPQATWPSRAVATETAPETDEDVEDVEAVEAVEAPDTAEDVEAPDTTEADPVAGVEAVADEGVAEPEPQAAGTTARRDPADPESRQLHDDFRRVVAPVHAVPRFEPLEGAGELPVVSHDIERRSRPGRERRRVQVSWSEAHRQTLIMAGVILLLAVVGIIYALGHDGAGEAQDELSPPAQGASRTQLQPSSDDLS